MLSQSEKLAPASTGTFFNTAEKETKVQAIFTQFFKSPDWKSITYTSGNISCVINLVENYKPNEFENVEVRQICALIDTFFNETKEDKDSDSVIQLRFICNNSLYDLVAKCNMNNKFAPRA